jgi:hypothetical protein
MRLPFAFVAIVACVISCGFSDAQESSPPAEEQTSVSPDKKWEYSDGDTAQSLTSDLPRNSLPLPGQSVAPTVEEKTPEERRVPARMGQDELPLADEHFRMPWHLMWPE